jgi:Outer membrane protein beta-barrel domain
MKKIIFLISFASPFFAHAQIGIKAGLNFANVTKASSVNNSSRSGFHAGIFLAPPAKGILGSRTELIFSRQGYNYKTASNTGNVNLDYIMMPQYMQINITKYFSLMLGGQIAYLLNAKVDSSAGSGGPAGNIMNTFNRFDYGYGGGVEIHPFKGLLLGARINISLGNLYTDILTTATPGTMPSFIPKVNVKNNLFQVYAGWKFGGNKDKKEKKEEAN